MFPVLAKTRGGRYTLTGSLSDFMTKYPTIILVATITVTETNIFPARTTSIRSFAREDSISAGVAI